MAADNLTRHAESRTPCILVAGPTGVGKSTLCRGITGVPDLDSQECTPWTIYTKYYTAKVDVCEATVGAGFAAAQPEALVLVFSLAAPDTFKSLELLGGRLDLEAVEVKLLCGTHADALLGPSGDPGSLEAAPQPDWFQRAFEWSIENGFELILCCPAAPSVDAALVLDGDRQGVVRVV
jgi:hypothetical protein